jgi:hypothetical protein
VCPKARSAASCPFSATNAFAYQKEMIDALPFRSKKLTIKNRYFFFLHLKVKVVLYCSNALQKISGKIYGSFRSLNWLLHPKKASKQN